MPFLIDGHNLIPDLPGVTLKDVDDELELVKRLQRFSRQTRSKVEVYFDQAPPGQAGKKSFGLVAAFFVARDQTADEAIGRRLASLGKEAKNWTVVSSDGDVLRAAKTHQAQVLSVQEFNGLLARKNPTQKRIKSDKWDPSLSDGDVDYWMRLFRGDES